MDILKTYQFSRQQLSALLASTFREAQARPKGNGVRVRQGEWVFVCQPWFGIKRRAKVDRVSAHSIFVEGRAYNRQTGVRSFNDRIEKLSNRESKVDKEGQS